MGLIVYVTVGIPQFAAQIATLGRGQHAVSTIAALQCRNLALFPGKPPGLMRRQAAVADTLADLSLLPVLQPVDATLTADLMAPVETALMPPVPAAMPAAPVMIVAQLAQIVDLDGPLLLDKDRPYGLHIENGRMSAPSRELWG